MTGTCPYCRVHGFQSAECTIEVIASPSPPAGAASGLSYTVTMYTGRGNPGLIVAEHSHFSSKLSTETTPGGEAYTFTAAATQTLYFAIFPDSATTTDFEIFVEAPWVR